MGTSGAEDWNAYWTNFLQDSSRRSSHRVGWPADLLTRHLHLLRKRQVRRILLTGNGCSALPYALVHLGFEVTVVDISSVANESLASVQPSAEMISYFLPEHRKEKHAQFGTIWVYDREASLRRVE